ncbi:hypothetical protein [Kribbella karoonensis]|uniref:Uncharacterized protein n=1 Tax=Kribbella karoonensis TaxID=324851 RepID=A0ABP4QHT3_9ACTN
MSDRIESPRLQELDPAKTAEFWTEVAEQGTPMVEANLMQHLLARIDRRCVDRA